MTNNEIISYIYKGRNTIKDKKDNSIMVKLLEKLGNPQDNLKFIHITGTNGKGSTTTMMANVLKNSGYKVGKFISPFIISFNERIQINNVFITDEELEEYIKIIDPIITDMESNGEAPNGFEIITAIAFMHYNKNNCDIVCLEVGMGGRLDPTNVITTTILSIITVVDFDHTKFLGNTLQEIAKEKCGIIKKDKITITYPMQDKSVLNTIRKTCMENNNKLYIPNLKFLDIIKCNHNISYFSYKGTYYKLNLIGEFQIYNALMVILASNILINLGYKISFSAINTGLFDSTFPARLEKIESPINLFIDGSHNAAGARSLKSFLHEYKGKKNYAIIGFAENKDYDSFIQEIGSYFNELIFVQFQNEYKKPEKTSNLLECAKKYEYCAVSFDTLEEAYKYVQEKENVDLTLVTGSLYLASNFRDMLTKE